MYAYITYIKHTYMVRCAGRALGSLMGKNFLAHEIHICASLRTQFISHQGYPEVFKP